MGIIFLAFAIVLAVLFLVGVVVSFVFAAIKHLWWLWLIGALLIVLGVIWVCLMVFGVLFASLCCGALSLALLI